MSSIDTDNAGMRRGTPIKTAPVPVIQRPSAEDVDPRGLLFIRMKKAGLVGDRVCEPGDIISMTAPTIT